MADPASDRFDVDKAAELRRLVATLTFDVPERVDTNFLVTTSRPERVRWSFYRKAALLRSIALDDLSVAECISRFRLSVDELLAWAQQLKSGDARRLCVSRERGVSVAPASRDIDVREIAARETVQEFATDPKAAFPDHGRQKFEQLEIERLRREVMKLKTERDILKKAAAYFAREAI
jgi:transposase